MDIGVIREALDEIFEDNLEKYSFYSEKAKVTAVDETAGTCTITLAADDAPIPDVPFKTSKNNAEGIFITPTVGKYVMISWLNNEVCFVSLVQDYDKVTIKKGGISIVMDGTDVVVNGGTKTVALAPLVKAQLNTIEIDVNALKTAWATAKAAGALAVTPGDGGVAYMAAYDGVFSTFYGAALNLSTDGDLESPNFKSKE